MSSLMKGQTGRNTNAVLQKDADNPMSQKYMQRQRFGENENEKKRVTYTYHQEEPTGISDVRNGEGDFEKSFSPDSLKS